MKDNRQRSCLASVERDNAGANVLGCSACQDPPENGISRRPDIELADLFLKGHRPRSLSIVFIGEARSYQYNLKLVLS